MKPELIVRESNKGDEDLVGIGGTSSKSILVSASSPSNVLTELLCSESPIPDEMDQGSNPYKTSSSSVNSYFDVALLHHPEILGQLQLLQTQNRQPHNYFGSGEKEEILPYMRKVVSMWMLEVCEEQNCEDTIFPLAVSLLDLVLGCTQIKAQQLQLLACVCLLLASKTRQESHFSLQLLSWYTENSVTLQALMTWEIMILTQLDWDINIITAMDFVDFLLVRTPSSDDMEDEIGNERFELLRRHATTFISMCYTEPRFVNLSPSLIAASAIYTAIRGIGQGENEDVGAHLADMAQVSLEQLQATVGSIDQVITKELTGTEQTIDHHHQKSTSFSPPAVTGSIPVPSSGSSVCNQTKSATTSTCGSAHFPNLSSLTPTDIQDIFC